jgi:hypothetical protein
MNMKSPKIKRFLQLPSLAKGVLREHKHFRTTAHHPLQCSRSTKATRCPSNSQQVNVYRSESLRLQIRVKIKRE